MKALGGIRRMKTDLQSHLANEIGDPGIIRQLISELDDLYIIVTCTADTCYDRSQKKGCTNSTSLEKGHWHLLRIPGIYDSCETAFTRPETSSIRWRKPPEAPKET